MLCSVVADAIALVHLGFILFVATGAVLAHRWPVLVWGLLLALASSAASLTVWPAERRDKPRRSVATP